MTPNKPAHTTTDRGFRKYEPVQCTYGNTVRVHQSSSAERAAVWLNLAYGPKSVLVDRWDGKPDLSAHLNASQAREVRDQLSAWLTEVAGDAELPETFGLVDGIAHLIRKNDYDRTSGYTAEALARHLFGVLEVLDGEKLDPLPEEAQV